MKFLIAALIYFSAISTSFAKDDKKRSLQRKPASDTILVAEGGQAQVFKFVDIVEGKKMVCYFTDTKHIREQVASEIQCIPLN